MRDILTDLIRWTDEGQSLALATVVRTWGSAPRRAGSRMAIAANGDFRGSVSGGCVENAVILAGREVIATGRPRLLSFGVADEAAWEVGLACGGLIEVFVAPLDPDWFDAVSGALQGDRPLVTACVIHSPGETNLGAWAIYMNGRLFGGAGLNWETALPPLMRETLADGNPRRVRLAGSLELFLDPIPPPPTLVIVGGVHIAAALATLARTAGYRTILIDSRRAWGNRGRFPQVDQLIQDDPERAFQSLKLTRSTAVAVLTHDPKLDDPALLAALPSPAFYVGALGSRSTHQKRRERLSKRGLTEAQLNRLHAPIGLDIGAQEPEEIALAVLAQVVQAHRSGRIELESGVLQQSLEVRS